MTIETANKSAQLLSKLTSARALLSFESSQYIRGKADREDSTSSYISLFGLHVNSETEGVMELADKIFDLRVAHINSIISKLEAELAEL